MSDNDSSLAATTDTLSAAIPALDAAFRDPFWSEVRPLHDAWLASRLGIEVRMIPDLLRQLDAHMTAPGLGRGESPLDRLRNRSETQKPGGLEAFTTPQTRAPAARLDIGASLRPGMDLRAAAGGAARTGLKEVVSTPVPGQTSTETGGTDEDGNRIVAASNSLRTDGSTVETSHTIAPDGTQTFQVTVRKHNGPTYTVHTTISPDGGMTHTRSVYTRDRMDSTTRTSIPLRDPRINPDPVEPEPVEGVVAPGQNAPDLSGAPPTGGTPGANPGPDGAQTQPAAAQLRPRDLATDPWRARDAGTARDAARLMEQMPRMKTPGSKPEPPPAAGS